MSNSEKSDIIQLKHYPENYSNDLISAINILSFPEKGKGYTADKPKLYGSASIKLSSPSDYDTLTEIKTNNINVIVKELQKIVKNCNNALGLWVADIKCGSVDEIKIIPDDLEEKNYNKNLEIMKTKTKQIFDKKIISKEEYNYYNSLLLSDLNNFDISILRKEIRPNIIRWTVDDILKGYITWNGFHKTLKECLMQPELTKIDIITFIQGYRYTEVSMVYLINLNGKNLSLNFEKDRIRLLKETIPPLMYDGKLFKICKRIFAIERYNKKPNKRVIKILIDLFNSNIGRLYQIVGDLSVLLYMADNYKNLPLKKIEFELDQIRFRTSSLTNEAFLKHEKEYLTLLGKFQNEPLKHLKEMEKFHDEIFNLMNDETYKFLKENKMWPIPDIYLPSKNDEKIIKNDEIYKDIEIKGKGEESKKKHKTTINDLEGSMLGSGKYEKIPTKDLIKEHKKLIGVLTKGTPREQIIEALDQYKELQTYLKDYKE